MRYHNILKENMVNGDGMRAVLFVSGCTHHCPQCQNPITWNKNDGLVFDEAAKAELFAELEKSYVSGVTFSGGDPLAMYNREEILSLIREVKEKFPDKTVWVYTGWTIEELKDQGFWDKLSPSIDVLVEGKFEIQYKSVPYNWAGSTNQRVLRKESNFTINTSDFIFVAMQNIKDAVKFADPSIKNKVYESADHIVLVSQNLEPCDKDVRTLIKEMDCLVPDRTESEIREDFEDALKNACIVAQNVERTNNMNMEIVESLLPYSNKSNLSDKECSDITIIKNSIIKKYNIPEETFNNFCTSLTIPYCEPLQNDVDIEMEL